MRITLEREMSSQSKHESNVISEETTEAENLE